MADEASDEEDVVLSEVHVGSHPGCRISCTVFFIDGKCNGEERLHNRGHSDADAELCFLQAQQMDATSSKSEKERTLGNEAGQDGTGDLEVPRKRPRQRSPGIAHTGERLVIHHSLATALPDVGLQVWRGALLLADYLFHEEFTSGRFKGVAALEVGAGTGLAGIVMARTAMRVYITDKGEDVLDMCLRNVTNDSAASRGHVAVRELDWFKFPASLDVGAQPAHGQPFDIDVDKTAGKKQTQDLLSISQARAGRRNAETKSNALQNARKEHFSRNGNQTGARSRSGSGSPYQWTSAELEDLRQVTVLLAADVIYDDSLTDALFECIEKLLSFGEPKVLLLALEKRYNFSLDERAVVANGYRNFRSKFDDVSSHGGGLDCPANGIGKLYGQSVPIDTIPQYLHPYERGPDLELWELRTPD